MRDTIIKISEYDNKWKIHYLDSLSKVDTINKNIYYHKYDSIVTRLVELRLIPLIKKYGYPGERLIGVGRVGNPKDPYNYSINNNRVLFVLLHYYTFPRDCKFNTLLYQQVTNGNLSPQNYASIMDFQTEKSPGNSCGTGYFNQWLSSDQKEDFDAINKRRSRIGLCTYQEELQKYTRGLNICNEYDEGKYQHIRLFYWCG